jgi:hypothetical protein
MGIEVATSKTLCDYGSGKLLRDCHMLLNLPKESFLVNITKKLKSMKHVVTRNGIQQELVDEILEMEMTAADPKPWDHEIVKIIQLSERMPNSQKDFEERAGKLRHKLDALKYHSLIFKNEEDRLIKEYQTSYTSENIHYSLENPTLIYNTEAFLFQTKSCLDVLSQIIAMAFKLSWKTYKNNGDDMIKQIRNKQLTGFPDQCTKMIELIESNKTWIRLAVEMRDQVTHYSNLIGLSCFRHRAWYEVNQSQAKIYYPALPNRERVSKYMDEIWDHVIKLIEDTFQIIVSIYSSATRT